MRTDGRFIPCVRPERPKYESPGQRAGTTLIELLVVITVAAVMLGLGVTTIHLLLGAEHEASRSVRYAASLSRLAQAFRDDVHPARSVELPEVESGRPEMLVISAGGDPQIRYELEANRATRFEAAQDGPAHRDTFYFPPRSRLSFAREATGGLVRLEIEMAAFGPANAATLPPRRLAIEAAPARRRPFEIRLDEDHPATAAESEHDEETGKGANDR
jgi:type II secretory pathway pseudopilin PulG